MTLARYKLSVRETRARILPAEDALGRPFTGPGVDLVGAEAREALARAAPTFAWLARFEPGVVVRSLSVDCGTGRVLATLETGALPRVVRLDAPTTDGLRDASRALEAFLEERALAALARREG